MQPHFKQLFALKGNYDEGFGKEQHKTKWAPSTGGFEAAQADTTAPSKVAGIKVAEKPEVPVEEAPVEVEAATEPVVDESAETPEPSSTPEPVEEEATAEEAASEEPAAEEPIAEDAPAEVEVGAE